ncbi:UDP-N-acetylmuramoyl-L-alanyl-D-glutamate--2,6-diaminopimelate ligase [Psychrobacillus sp. INOP01]|uniref:UDP-N-acetylmuramoyl-L-alanyl-D-glutamate--2, 6-diaminopimelate ligase n=1 Tax=Psychrobacillus sp. INOP01 TaxID=2829187 RepID=UPI001BA6E079|nr:UDP-N-acetylmuramoyl-L-alanyl-D-glutamate--2,6-diaminopimelate ligase [Psychrobacillus sp. INOP01]QUG42009.1 UDP-N-acetylmuramoyl-L-alanyl-D-glutamate--2,6-diaminopimelate ligase [Psychrobacillus sp. INOP01]
MKLETLIAPLGIHISQEDKSIEIKGLAFNSSKVEQNFIFVAIRGTLTDGHTFIEDAILNGACVVIGEENLISIGVPYIRVANSRKALGLLANIFYENPTQNKIMIGITGTNGKTTTSYMLKHILESVGISCSLFGSVSTIINGIENESTHTTADAVTLNQLLARCNDHVVIMEVSSHGLVQSRVEGLRFDYCIFTNLEHEHLDYHENMESYYLAKQSLFNYLKPHGIAVINSDSSCGERLCTYVTSLNKEVIKINGKKPSYTVNDEELISLKDPIQSYSLNSRMKGKHNLENASLAFSTAISLNIDPLNIERSLENFSGVPGRFELFQHPAGATCIVDYAHTGNAFSHILETASLYNPQRIIHIFGFRGNRDVQKRKNMVQISLEKCHLCILTFDDLNGVPSEQMIQDLYALDPLNRCIIIPDRTLAIQYAWEKAKNNDFIVITGKGIENYQQSFSLPTASDIHTLNYLNDSFVFQNETLNQYDHPRSLY